ncbi:hypothetical protein TNCV_3588801 [Trichonephila clavipes]|nr:hypothetical protein TNCV_3588801 [Trichonephila clavipes]
MTHQFLSILNALSTRLPKSKIPGATTFWCVSNPLRLYENNSVYYCEAYCENTPQNTNSFRISHIVRMVSTCLRCIFVFSRGIHRFNCKHQAIADVFFEFETREILRLVQVSKVFFPSLLKISPGVLLLSSALSSSSKPIYELFYAVTLAHPPDSGSLAIVSNFIHNFRCITITSSMCS